MSDPTLHDSASGSSYPPASTDPLSPGRTDVSPSDEPGVDDLPDNDGETPEEQSPTPYEQGVPDMDPDNAEMDDQPNPR